MHPASRSAVPKIWVLAYISGEAEPGLTQHRLHGLLRGVFASTSPPKGAEGFPSLGQAWAASELVAFWGELKALPSTGANSCCALFQQRCQWVWDWVLTTLQKQCCPSLSPPSFHFTSHPNRLSSLHIPFYKVCFPLQLNMHNPRPERTAPNLHHGKNSFKKKKISLFVAIHTHICAKPPSLLGQSCANCKTPMFLLLPLFVQPLPHFTFMQPYLPSP